MWQINAFTGPSVRVETGWWASCPVSLLMVFIAEFRGWAKLFDVNLI